MPAGPFGNYGAGAPFEGFNFQRGQDPQQSAKDAFAYAVDRAFQQQRPNFDTRDAAAATAYFNQYIRPTFEAFGHRVDAVNGDRFTFTSPEGQFEVDWIRGWGAPNWGMAWQVQGPSTGPALTSTPSAAGGSRTASTFPNLADPFSALQQALGPLLGTPATQSQSAVQQILAQLTQQINQSQDPMVRQAVLELLSIFGNAPLGTNRQVTR